MVGWAHKRQAPWPAAPSLRWFFRCGTVERPSSSVRCRRRSRGLPLSPHPEGAAPPLTAPAAWCEDPDGTDESPGHTTDEDTRSGGSVRVPAKQGPRCGVYTRAEVAAHCTPSSCWLIAHGRVYDVTEFAAHHPGGTRALFDCAGGDCSREYDRHRLGDPAVRAAWDACRIGRLRRLDDTIVDAFCVPWRL
eukprot:TRINITY_DN17462_c0_g1_i1.p1 TRINITY_DN17462_c0_g1~~TRINITY_DN17462_c0_g1_i1.p1  ORF type:complete len:212 (+),score=59.41 TRINITY_DN17462_c0_g1_i1:64-636(+)